MNWCMEMFGVEKPIIALLHLNAFPGEPRFIDGVDSMEKAVEDARKDLHALQDGGVDGILFSNEFSFPYQVKVDPVVACGMARIIGELKSEIKLPFGVDLESDPMTTLEVAAAVGANFVRGIFTGTYVGVGGITMPDIAALLRRKKALGLNDLKLLYFLNNEADAYLGPVDYADLATAIEFNCKPDALCVTGAHAGIEAESSLIEQVKDRLKNSPTRIFASTDVRRIILSGNLIYPTALLLAQH